MNGNITKVNLACGKDNLASPLYQYDYGQVLQLLGVTLPEAYEVHFSNSPRGEAKTAIGNEDGVIIPDEYLLTGAPVYAWLYLHTGESDGETEYRITIPVIARAKPTDAEPTPVQQDAITQAIAALNTAVTETAQSAEAAAGSAELAEDSAELAERYALTANSAADNADTSAQNAAQSASEAATSATEAEAARDTITGMSVTAQTLPAGSDATASWADGTLALGIPRGGKGDTGNGIASAVLNADYTLTLTFTDGTSYTTPSIRGVIGETGKGIASAVLNADYTLTLTFTDGTSYTTPSIRGANGVGVPAGGTTGQVLTKASGTDYDTEWADPVEIDPTLVVSGEAADAKATGDAIRAMCPVATVGPSAIVSVDDAVPLVAEGLVAQIEPVQAGSGDPSPDNVRPISGWTGCEVKHSGADVSDPTIISVTFPASAGTVYGGYVDLVNGKLVVERAMVDLGTLNWLYDNSGTYPIFYTIDLVNVIKRTVGTVLLCTIYTQITGGISTTTMKEDYPQSNVIAVTTSGILGRVIVRNDSYTDAASFKSAMSGVQLVYELATPITYDIDPVALTLLRGANNIWADTGDTTLTYRQDGLGAVQDVQVNGTSVVTDGVANVPIATNLNVNYGVVKLSSSRGLTIDTNGELRVNPATLAAIKSGASEFAPLGAYRIKEGVFYGLAKAASDTTQAQSSNAVGNYTEIAKSKISEMLNAPVSVSGTTPTITALSGIQYVCGEVATLDITLPESGIVDVVFQSGSTPTVLTVTPPTGMTVEWANGFDSTALEADTLYELNVKMVGTKCLGVAGAWS